jgi:hypothetical protein
MKKEILVPIVVALVVGVLAFWGGNVYSKKSLAKTMMGQGQRQGGVGQNRFGNGQPGMMGSRIGNGANLANGEIVSKDDKSITIKLRDGGSKIIFLSGTTAINKSAAGTIDDLKVGTQVTATGTTNTDGSVSAQMVQIRPEMTATTTPTK